MAQKTPSHNGKPSGADKQESGTGIPMNISDDNMQNDQDLTERYTDDDKDIAEGVRTLHPNRNTDKVDGSNIGGYRE